METSFLIAFFAKILNSSVHMLNSSVFSLISAFNAATSPHFMLKGNFNMKQCIFSHQFSPVLSNFATFSRLQLHSTKFNNMLLPAVHLSSREYSNILYRSQLSITEESVQITIKSCGFYKISLNTAGSGLYIKVDSADVQITNTGFSECASKKQGSAFYVTSKTLEFTYNCINNCQLKSNLATIASMHQGKKNVIETSYISNTVGTKSQHVFDIKAMDSTITKCNFSSLADVNEVIYSSVSGDVSLSETIFDSNNAGYIIVTKDYDVNTYQNNFFISNHADTAIVESHDKKLVLISSGFANDKSLKYASNEGIQFRECKFTESETKVSKKVADAEKQLKKCIFDQNVEEIKIKIPRSDECWELFPTQKPIIGGLNAKTIIAIIVALTIIIGALGFVYFRLCKKRSDETTLLRYTM